MGPKKFGQKTFWSKKILVEIFFLTTIFFGLKFFWVGKKFGLKKIWIKKIGSKKFAVKKNFGQKIWSTNILDSKKICVEICFESTKFFRQKNLGLKKWVGGQVTPICFFAYLY